MKKLILIFFIFQSQNFLCKIHINKKKLFLIPSFVFLIGLILKFSIKPYKQINKTQIEIIKSEIVSSIANFFFMFYSEKKLIIENLKSNFLIGYNLKDLEEKLYNHYEKSVDHNGHINYLSIPDFIKKKKLYIEVKKEIFEKNEDYSIIEKFENIVKKNILEILLNNIYDEKNKNIKFEEFISKNIYFEFYSLFLEKNNISYKTSIHTHKLLNLKDSDSVIPNPFVDDYHKNLKILFGKKNESIQNKIIQFYFETSEKNYKEKIKNIPIEWIVEFFKNLEFTEIRKYFLSNYEFFNIKQLLYNSQIINSILKIKTENIDITTNFKILKCSKYLFEKFLAEKYIINLDTSMLISLIEFIGGDSSENKEFCNKLKEQNKQIFNELKNLFNENEKIKKLKPEEVRDLNDKIDNKQYFIFPFQKSEKINSYKIIDNKGNIIKNLPNLYENYKNIENSILDKIFNLNKYLIEEIYKISAYLNAKKKFLANIKYRKNMLKQKILEFI